MYKRLPKIFIIIFISIFILQIFALFFLLLTPNEANAVELQVAIGDKKSVSGIAEYIKAIYKYGTGVVGILAAVVLMVGGLIWLTAGGNQEKVSDAQQWIKAALTGLVITLLSYIILQTINPDLVNLKPLSIDKVQRIPGGYGFVDSGVEGWDDFISNPSSLSEGYIAKNEGIRLSVYKDSKGYETIGIGHKLESGNPRDDRIREKGSISEEEAYKLFEEDYIEAMAIMRTVTNEKTGQSYSTLAPARRAVLIDMAYNMGQGGLAGFNKMYDAIKEGNFDKAGDEIEDENSDYAKQVGARAVRNAQIMRSGEMLE